MISLKKRTGERSKAAATPNLPGRATHPRTQRLEVLDGLRAVAALLVVVYHVFARWSEPLWPTTLYPHGNLLVHAPWITVFGEVGIHLFFLVSGFVILMTLERSSGIVDFTARRAARLWPAMLVCATLSTLLINSSGIADYFGVARWHVEPAEYAWSLIFVPPDLGQRLLGFEDTRLQWVEGTYWTLWHEVRFYAMIAIIFLASPRAWFLWAWAGVQAISTGLGIWELSSGQIYPLGFAANLVFQPKMLAWFSLGVCGYAFWTGRRSPVLPVMAILALCAIAADHLREVPLNTHWENWLHFWGYTGVLMVFVLFLARSPLLAPFAARPLVVVGLASYPLYLFHERPSFVFMKYGMEWGLPPLAVALVAIACLVAFSILLHRVVEQPGKRWLTKLFCRDFLKLEKRAAWLRY